MVDGVVCLPADQPASLRSQVIRSNVRWRHHNWREPLTQIEEKPVPHEDEVYYERVAAKLESGQLRSGLWTKALARAMGDEALARPLYIE